MSEPDWNQEPCGCAWKERYTDDTTSHLHICQLQQDHGRTRGSGELDHHCQCGATFSGSFRPECGASAWRGHQCSRIRPHTIRLPHKCHCGYEFKGESFNRPLVIRRRARAGG